MTKNDFSVVILAAGAGTRMESPVPKVLHPVSGRPMIYYLMRLAASLKPKAIAVVLGHESKRVESEAGALAKEAGLSRLLSFVRQKQLRGSGHAVWEARETLKKHPHCLVLYGDTPLLTYETLSLLLQNHFQAGSQVTFLTARVPDPQGYGRVIRGPTGEVVKIVEEADAASKELAASEVNAGVYCFRVPELLSALKEVPASGPKQEHYLTSAVEILRAKGAQIKAYLTPHPEEALGVNSRRQLAQVEAFMSRRILDRLMLAGVRVMDPGHTYVDSTVEVGSETVLHPGTLLKGKTVVGRRCEIGPYAYLEDAQLSDGVRVRFCSCLTGAKVLEEAVVGPFAHLRPETLIGARAKVGNFVEIKKSRVGEGSKVPHLSYVGDAMIANKVNVGAGTITCNYDGMHKHVTEIAEGAFIGSNVNLVAPVKIGRNAEIAAGSTITEDVPEGKRAFARARQILKDKKIKK